jgi:hypothetical protein
VGGVRGGEATSNPLALDLTVAICVSIVGTFPRLELHDHHHHQQQQQIYSNFNVFEPNLRNGM